MSFDQIIGQDTAIRLLKSSLAHKRRGISYLFYGPEGVGKFFCARQFAKSLICLDTEGICDECPSCKRIDNFSHPDVHFLDLNEDSENISIEQIRALQGNMYLRPYEAPCKVFIINNCDYLSPNAASSLLKIIEEPAMDSVIILISSKMQLLLGTIISRCQKIKFSSIPVHKAHGLLTGDLKFGIQQGQYLSRYLEGRIGQAIALGREGFFDVKNDILNEFFDRDGETGLEGFFKDKKQAAQTLSVLLSWFRDIMLVKIGLEASCLINIDREQELARRCAKYTMSQIYEIFSALIDAFKFMDENVNTKILIDHLRCKIWTN